MRRSQQGGLTLIEVLIAVSLVSLLAVGMLFAIRAGLSAMDSSGRWITSNRRAMGAQRVLEQQVAGVLPVVVQCGPPGAGPGPRTPFFQGTPAVMRFVTSYSLDGAARGMPKIAVLFVIQGENGVGVRLVVNEIPYNGPVGAGFQCLPPAPDPMTGASMTRFPQPQPGPGSFVLADKLSICRFLFLEGMDPEPDRWVPFWTRLDKWPKAVRVEMAPLEADPSRIPPLTFTGLIRPNRPPLEQYAFWQ